MKKLSSERLKELFKDHEPMIKAFEESFDDIVEAPRHSRKTHHGRQQC